METCLIKSIDTIYKGYKFRSRLEARWAYYFDLIGQPWQYEPEGFQFADGTKYLPDFYLPGLGCYLEIKPESTLFPKVPKVYLAGKMGHAFRRGLGKMDDIYDDAPESYFRIGNHLVKFMGPFNSDKEFKSHRLVDRHGRKADADGGGEIDEKRIADCCKIAIQQSDVILCYIDCQTSFGTLAEIGYAAGIGKRVAIFEVGEKTEDEASLLDENAPYTDFLWFAKELSSALCMTHWKDQGDPIHAFYKWADAILSSQPEFRCRYKSDDVVKVENMLCAGKTITVYIGDPLEHTSWPGHSHWLDREAAKEARRARFEHDEAVS